MDGSLWSFQFCSEIAVVKIPFDLVFIVYERFPYLVLYCVPKYNYINLLLSAC